MYWMVQQAVEINWVDGFKLKGAWIVFDIAVGNKSGRDNATSEPGVTVLLWKLFLDL